jgi:hypothetical protein
VVNCAYGYQEEGKKEKESVQETGKEEPSPQKETSEEKEATNPEEGGGEDEARQQAESCPEKS